ncbi:MAG TPA: RHS repeat-associated core domain-containing protein [Ktedonobacteraceae bacterium]|jgi:RHS repeat-associated protein
MLQADGIANGVRLASGEVSFLLNLAQVPGRNGLDVSLDLAYSSAVQAMATGWNLSSPTGVAGLGWAFPVERIVCAPRQSTDPAAASFYLLAGQASTALVCSGRASDGALLYQGESFSFWRIAYYPERRRWQVIRENGDTSIYGDAQVFPDALQWGIAWDNWRDASAQLRGQQPYPLAFDLAQISNRFGDTITYTYHSEVQFVGPAPAEPAAVRPFYTRASALATITAPGGERIVLTYGDKRHDEVIQEYIDPHTSPPVPNAFQSRLATRYLESVEIFATSGALLSRTQLLYTTPDGSPAFVGSGAQAKRLLTALRQVNGSGSGLPGVKYTYYGQESADGVSASVPYNADTKALYGALKTALNPLGGSTTYHYTHLSLALAQRACSVSAPVQAGVSFTLPRCSFARDYTLLTWFASDQSLRICAYFWDGRWLDGSWARPGQSVVQDTLPVTDATAYAAVPLLCRARFFAAFSQNQVHLNAARRERAGEWTQPAVSANGVSSSYFTTTLLTQEAASLCAGETFACILGEHSGQLYRYRWDGLAWQADPLLTLSAGGTPATFAATACQNYLFALATASGQPGDPLHLSLYSLDETGRWQTLAVEQERPLPVVDGVSLVAGETFVVALLHSTAGGALNGACRLYWWDRTFSRLAAQDLGTFLLPPGSTLPTPVVQGSCLYLGQLFARFDGTRWQVSSVAQLDPAADGTLLSIGYGRDQAVRSIQNADAWIYDLVQYVPDAALWRIPGNLSLSEAASTRSNLVARDTDAPGTFVVVASRLFAHQPDDSWQDTGVRLPALSGDDALSPQLFGERYLLYQQAGNTLVQLLKNGAPAGSILQLNAQQIYAAGVNLCGPQAFVTYSGTFGSAGSNLRLYRVTQEGVSGPLGAYALLDQVATSPYQSSTTTYTYTTASATADRGEEGACYNQVRVRPQGEAEQDNGWIDYSFFSGLTPGEPPALAYPVDSATTNAPASYSLVRGLPYSARVFPAGAAPGGYVSEDIDYWWVFRLALGSRAQGYYLRVRRDDAMIDQVATSALHTYSAESGLVLSHTVSTFNSSGLAEQLVEIKRYFWEVYDPARTLNLLTPVIQSTWQTVSAGTTSVTGIEVTTYRDEWGSGAGQWASYKTYRALQADPPPFQNWQPGQGDPASGWLRTLTVSARTASGLVAQSLSVDGIVSQSLFDASGAHLTAAFFHASVSDDEASYYGFDPYERAQGWGWTAPDHTLSEYLTTQDAHTGSQCLLLPASPQSARGPARTFLPGGQQRTYVFSCWYKTPGAFDPARGAAQWTIAVVTADAAATALATLTLPMADTANRWVYLQQVIDLPALRQHARPDPLPATTPLSLRISAANRNDARPVLVDNLRFSPVDGLCWAAVYDPDHWLMTAALDHNGQVNRWIYDAYQRVVATTTPQEGVASVVSQAYARDLSGNDTFVPQFPNSRIQLGTTSQSLFYDFHSANLLSEWTLSGAGGTWGVAAGQLTFTGSSTDRLGSTAVAKMFAFTNLAIRVVCSAHTGNAGVGNGDAFALWDQHSQSWKLVRRQVDADPLLVHESTATGFHSEWIFLLVEGLLLFYAGGIQIFAFAYQNPNTALPDVGKPALLLTQTGSFDDLVVLDNPQLAVSFQDGFGHELHSLRLRGLVAGTTPAYQAIGRGTFLDSVGRPRYIRNAAPPSLQIDQPPAPQPNRYLLLGDPTTYLVNARGQSISYQDYLAGLGGFAYTSIFYEPSPLSRVTGLLLPREQDQPAARFTISLAYGPATEELTRGILPPGVAGQYFMRTVTDQNGVQTATILDTLGRILASRVQLAPGVYHTRSYAYDAAGNLVSSRLPNFYDPPAGSRAADWQEVCTYTFHNLLQSRRTPDSGLVSYLYDNANRLRFSQDASSGQRILYYKYDSAGRLSEEGLIDDPHVTWSSVAAQVNTADFPDLTAVSGRLSRRFLYDVDRSRENQPVAPHLLGRLWKVELNNGVDESRPDSEIFAYTARGDVATHTLSVPAYDAGAYVTGYRYDNQRHLLQVTYPQKVGSSTPPFTVGYLYDRLGQLAAIGEPVPADVVVDPSQPATGSEARYALYGYNADGSLAQEQLNNWTDGLTRFGVTRTYSYDGASWLTRIEDPFFSEQLAYYETPGASGATYSNGLISRQALSFKPASYPAAPADYSYQFAYDPLNRVTAAVNSLNNAYTSFIGSQDRSLASYDANGNVLHVQRGATIQAYVYHPARGAQTDNRVYSLSSSVSSTLDFSTASTSPACAQGWCWGSNNGGPSSSHVVPRDGGPARCLQLGGGSPGHYEYLQLQTYLAPRGVYRLAYAVRTPPEFAACPGDAGWYLVLEAATGPVVEVNLAAIPATGGAWQTASIPAIDVAALQASSGLGADLVAVTLQLRNARQVASGSGPGSFMQVTDIQLTTTRTVNTADFGYNANGEVTAAPTRQISQIQYDPLIHRAQSIQQAGSPGRQLAFSYDSSGQRLLAQDGPLNSSPTTLTLYLYDQRGNPLCQATKSGGAETLTSGIYGPGGLLAFKTATGTLFPLKDHLTSTRLVIDQQDSVVGAQDYAPFGSTLRAQGSVGTAYLYTDQELDSQTKLYNYRARLYDPDLGRFYSPDPARQGTSPYAYVGNNPLSFIDPSGEQTVWVRQDLTTTELDSAWYWNLLLRFLPLSPGELDVLIRHFGADAVRIGWRISEINTEVYTRINANSNLFWRAKNTYRHPYWMCRLAQEFGETFALELGDAHERWHLELSNEGPYDSVTDKINNLIGVKLAASSLSGDCYTLTREAFARGDLASFTEVPGSNTPTTRPSYTVEFQTALDRLWARHKVVPTFDRYDEAVLKQHNIKVPSPPPAPVQTPPAVVPAPLPAPPPTPTPTPAPVQPPQPGLIELPQVQEPMGTQRRGTAIFQPIPQQGWGPRRP